MMTLRHFTEGLESVPATTSWYLADIAEARGKQELFVRQSPQRLKTLREHALVESAVSSTRIEGVNVDPSRVKTIVFGKASLRDRNEEEVRGYREALKLIHEQRAALPLSEEIVLELHRLALPDAWDAGKLKERNGQIIEKSADGRTRIRFTPVSAKRTPASMKELFELWTRGLKNREVHPLILAAAFNLDFLCIHPFRDGNGRVSRLLLLVQCYHLGYEVARYISIERLMEENKERYYETLEESSRDWHEGKHNLWPYINYLFFILKSAYGELEGRLGQVAEPRGAKTQIVQNALARFPGEFSVAELERSCPTVSRDMVRRVLRDLQKAGQVECLGHGPGARWRKKGNVLKKGKKEGN
ncbi:MAG: Fic family protein [bacterium]|nr:Fic family protein [bacterium]